MKEFLRNLFGKEEYTQLKQKSEQAVRALKEFEIEKLGKEAPWNVAEVLPTEDPYRTTPIREEPKKPKRGEYSREKYDDVEKTVDTERKHPSGRRTPADQLGGSFPILHDMEIEEQELFKRGQAEANKLNEQHDKLKAVAEKARQNLKKFETGKLGLK